VMLWNKDDKSQTQAEHSISDAC